MSAFNGEIDDVSANSFDSAEDASSEQLVAAIAAPPPRDRTSLNQLSSGSSAIAITPGSPHLSFAAVKKLSFSVAATTARPAPQSGATIAHRHRSRHSSFFDVPAHMAALTFQELAEAEQSTGPVAVADLAPAANAAPSTRGARIRHFFWLSLTALGVIYGDIGTSPLYAYSTSLAQLAPDGCADAGAACQWPSQADDALGILSLLIWSLTLVVTIQYVVVVLSLDSHGEGGTMALAAQIIESNAWPWLKSVALGASIVGTGFVLGDGCLTPAISVVSAIEGIAVYEASLVAAVVPISCVILFFLFMSQRFGTAKIGFLFGPVIALWFLSIGAIGIWKQVVAGGGAGALAWSAWNPAHAVNFFARHGEIGWLALGNVVLAITGVEALFADLGHFGAGPVRFGWLALAYPCLLLNYIGQAAHVLSPEGRADYVRQS